MFISSLPFVTLHRSQEEEKGPVDRSANFGHEIVVDAIAGLAMYTTDSRYMSRHAQLNRLS